MTTELDGFEPHHQPIDVRIGKPYTYFVPMVAQKGRLSLQVLPLDARSSSAIASSGSATSTSSSRATATW